MLLMAALGWRKAVQRKCAHWLWPYLVWAWRQRSRRRVEGPVHLFFLFADHFEPQHGGVSPAQEAARLQRWAESYPQFAARHRDAEGRPPQHTWFYPYDQYRPENLQQLSALCFAGWGEIELHLHHGQEPPERLPELLREAVETFAQHGALLTAEPQPRRTFGFVHGMFALDNARPDGRYCGVNNELQILREAGCYADFTLPTPDETQPRLVNTIYYATDDPQRPKSHDTGREVCVGGKTAGDLLLVPGPLGINWRDWRHGLYPALENTAITSLNPGFPVRVDFWVWAHIHVAGRPEWVFVKVYTHGALERDTEAVLGAARHALHDYLETRYNDGERYVLHYVTAREAYNLIKAAEAGEVGDPNQYRNYLIPPYANTKIWANRRYLLATYSPTEVVLRLLPGQEPAEVTFKDLLLRRLRGRFSSLHYRREGNAVTLALEGDGPVEGEWTGEIALKGVDQWHFIAAKERTAFALNLATASSCLVRGDLPSAI